MFAKKVLFIFFLFTWHKIQSQNSSSTLVILGIAQDGGSPQIGCDKSCCKILWEKKIFESVTSVGLIDNVENRFFLIDASPDITKQYQMLKSLSLNGSLGGIVLTHAHIGHYSGLLFFGKESLGARKINVYSMPKMSFFLKNNGPWSQLIQDKNIIINQLKNNTIQTLSKYISIKPIIVPHRDEFSETVGYLIKGDLKSALFLPDIDKWEKWDKNLKQLVYEFDYLLLDATFYDSKEINRDISEIPHPLVTETINLLDDLSPEHKNKVYFIHMNHTNLMLDPSSELTKLVVNKGFNITRLGLKLSL